MRSRGQDDGLPGIAAPEVTDAIQVNPDRAIMAEGIEFVPAERVPGLALDVVELSSQFSDLTGTAAGGHAATRVSARSQGQFAAIKALATGGETELPAIRVWAVLVSGLPFARVNSI